MAILVDDAIWPWRGMRWAHLVSDHSHDELHEFAHRLGMPYLAFQGDHYDIHTEMRARAIEAGAMTVPGRQLVVALREAGLRRRGGLPPWRWHRRIDARRVDAVDALPPMPRQVRRELDVALDVLREVTDDVEVGWASRSSEELVVVSSPDLVELGPDLDLGLGRLDTTTTTHRSRGERGTFIEWVTLT